MKKILLLLVFVIFSVVFASAKMVPYSSDGYNYDVEVNVEKGWNIVLMPSIDATGSGFLANSDIKKENVKVVYIYVPQKNRYYETYPDSSELSQMIASNPEYEVYLGMVSAWVYLDKGGYMRYKRIDVPNYSQVKLSNGWNFITRMPELKMKRLNQFKGDCDILKIAVWKDSKWVVLDPTWPNWNDIALADSDSDIGGGVLIKVSSECRFGSTAISPPPIPN